jgi:hypothetical protein
LHDDDGLNSVAPPLVRSASVTCVVEQLDVAQEVLQHEAVMGGHALVAHPPLGQRGQLVGRARAGDQAP